MIGKSNTGCHATHATPSCSLQIRQPGEDQEWQFAAEVKKGVVQRTSIGFIAQQLKRYHGQGVLVTRHIPPKVAAELRNLKIQFLDTAGNAFLNAPPLYVFITGNKPRDAQRLEPLGRAFRPAGLRVIFALLCQPGLENQPFRDIAQVAQVALGTVGVIMGDLKK